jgi:hypothetical protein
MNTQPVDLPQAAGRKFTIRAENFRRFRSKSLHGFVDLRIEELGFVVVGATLHRSHDKAWIGLPGAARLTREGEVQRGDNGKILYNPTLKIVRRDISDAFSSKAVEAVLQRFPDALNEHPEA